MNLQDINIRLMALLKRVTEELLRDAKLFRFDKGDPHQLYTVCIYCSIVEIAYGCIALLDKKLVTGFPTLLRSLLEAYADFLASIEDPKYHKNMYASFLKEKLRLLEFVEKNPENPYLRGIVEAVNIKTEKANIKAEMDKYKKENRGPLSTGERFNRGNLNTNTSHLTGYYAYTVITIYQRSKVAISRNVVMTTT